MRRRHVRSHEALPKAQRRVVTVQDGGCGRFEVRDGDAREMKGGGAGGGGGHPPDFIGVTKTLRGGGRLGGGGRPGLFGKRAGTGGYRCQTKKTKGLQNCPWVGYRYPAGGGTGTVAVWPYGWFGRWFGWLCDGDIH